jgi:hypothetical protein
MYIAATDDSTCVTGKETERRILVVSLPFTCHVLHRQQQQAAGSSSSSKQQNRRQAAAAQVYL